MMKTWLKMVMVFGCSMVLLIACNSGSSSSDDSDDSSGAEERLGIDGNYTVEYTINNCVKAFTLEIGDKQKLSTRWGEELDHCYLSVPANGKTVTYSFTEGGKTITRTVTVSGDEVTFDDAWEVAGVAHSANYELSFYANLKLFTIQGTVAAGEGCDGDVNAGGLGTNY